MAMDANNGMGQTPARSDGRRIDNWRDWLTSEHVSGMLANAVKLQAVAEPHASLGVWANADVGAMARALLELGAFGTITGRARPQTTQTASPEPPGRPKTPHRPTSPPSGNHNGTCCTCRYWKICGSEIDDNASKRETFFGACRFLPPGPDEHPWPTTDEDDTCGYHQPGTTDDEGQR